MTKYNMALSADKKEVFVSIQGDASPGSTTNIGSFDHDDDANDKLGHAPNHVIYHHVQEALYKVDPKTGLPGGFFPDNITDMASITITKHGSRINSTRILVSPKEVEITGTGTATITVKTFDDSDTETAGTAAFTSSTPEVATVNATTGVVTGVTPGTTTITVTKNGLTDTAEVTVVAAGG